MSERDRLAAAAQALVGTPFRLGGRDAATGLDCFGVLHAALVAIGHAASLPDNYRLRRIGLPDLAPWLAANGLHTTSASPRPGDVQLYQVGPAQPHLAILTGRGFVHAHLGIGQVLETPGAAPWPVLCHARLHSC